MKGKSWAALILVRNFLVMAWELCSSHRQIDLILYERQHANVFFLPPAWVKVFFVFIIPKIFNRRSEPACIQNKIVPFCSELCSKAQELYNLVSRSGSVMVSFSFLFYFEIPLCLNPHVLSSFLPSLILFSCVLFIISFLSVPNHFSSLLWACQHCVSHEFPSAPSFLCHLASGFMFSLICTFACLNWCAVSTFALIKWID